MSVMRAGGARGYTVIEVMMALAVLTLGASGVIAMQKATLISNTNARNLATANAIGQAWIERLRADALSWNEAGGSQDLPSTAWLNGAVNAAPTSGGGWVMPTMMTPPTPQPAGSPLADVMGADLYTSIADPAALVPAFCTQIRLTRFANSTTSSLVNFYKVIRVEVRVIWNRHGQPVVCTALPVAFDSDVGRWGITYLVSAVMENASPF